MWRKFLVATDQEEWEGVLDDLIEARNNADRFLGVIKGRKLRWLLHKVKTQYHHSRSFHVTGSRAAQRERLMNFFRNCDEIIQREPAVAAAAAEFQEARKRLTSDPGRMHLGRRISCCIKTNAAATARVAAIARFRRRRRALRARR